MSDNDDGGENIWKKYSQMKYGIPLIHTEGSWFKPSYTELPPPGMPLDIQKVVIAKVISMAREDANNLRAKGHNYACFEGLRAEYNGQARVLERLISALENLDLTTIEGK